ncbi:unnamed protein product [Ambrosiozyma monospora]|uniref:Unnamed protein product n=1 Tax=Ambrosiozyma monospora TaxID=43982 RepID=A0A9W7DBH3_AMBMO|nr:unnamed protein product [Ambrosiozyma monospora]
MDAHIEEPASHKRRQLLPRSSSFDTISTKHSVKAFSASSNDYFSFMSTLPMEIVELIFTYVIGRELSTRELCKLVVQDAPLASILGRLLQMSTVVMDKFYCFRIKTPGPRSPSSTFNTSNYTRSSNKSVPASVIKPVVEFIKSRGLTPKLELSGSSVLFFKDDQDEDMPICKDLINSCCSTISIAMCSKQPAHYYTMAFAPSPSVPKGYGVGLFIEKFPECLTKLRTFRIKLMFLIAYIQFEQTIKMLKDWRNKGICPKVILDLDLEPLGPKARLTNLINEEEIDFKVIIRKPIDREDLQFLESVEHRVEILSYTVFNGDSDYDWLSGFSSLDKLTMRWTNSEYVPGEDCSFCIDNPSIRSLTLTDFPQYPTFSLVNMTSLISLKFKSCQLSASIFQKLPESLEHLTLSEVTIIDEKPIELPRNLMRLNIDFMQYGETPILKNAHMLTNLLDVSLQFLQPMCSKGEINDLILNERHNKLHQFINNVPKSVVNFSFPIDLTPTLTKYHLSSLNNCKTLITNSDLSQIMESLPCNIEELKCPVSINVTGQFPAQLKLLSVDLSTSHYTVESFSESFLLSLPLLVALDIQLELPKELDFTRIFKNVSKKLNKFYISLVSVDVKYDEISIIAESVPPHISVFELTNRIWDSRRVKKMLNVTNKHEFVDYRAEFSDRIAVFPPTEFQWC